MRGLTKKIVACLLMVMIVFNGCGLSQIGSIFITTAYADEEDTTPPSAPGNLVCTGVTISSISLSWSASTDNIAVTGYKVYNGSVLLEETTELSCTIDSLNANTEYTFTIKAYDAAGNISIGTSIPVTTSRDTQAPTAPTNLLLVGKSDTVAAISWSASTDNIGVSGYKVYNGQTLVGTTSETSYTVENLNNATEYTFTVKAYDAANNLSDASNSLSVTTGLGIPANLAASPASTAITVTWNAVYGVNAYDLQIAENVISNINNTSYTCTGLTPSTTYNIKVRAKSQSNNGEWSNTIQSTTGSGTNVSGTISQNTTWTVANSPYRVTGSITVASGVTLTIEPGAIIKFNNSSYTFQISGTLNASGTAEAPIIFTSTGDPVYGDGTGTRWSGLIINSTGVANLNYTKIRYTGSDQSILAYGDLNIANSEVINATGRGINIINTTASDITIENNLIDSCLIAVEIRNYVGGNFTIENNTLSNNSLYATWIYTNNFKPDSLTGFDSNTFNGRQYFTGGTFYVDLTLKSNTYIFGGTVTVSSGVTLTIEPGAIIKFNNSSYTFQISGTLNANGTSEVPIIFTSTGDPVYGDGATIRWAGFVINSTGVANLNYTKIRYTGSDQSIMSYGNLNVTNSEITDASGRGINIIANNTADITIENNLIANCWIGVEIRGYTNGIFTMENNTISNNGCAATWIYTSNFKPDSFIGFYNNTFGNSQYFTGGTFYVDFALKSNTYTFGGTMTIPAGVTLNIDPGSLIKISGSTSYSSLRYIQVQGTLNANGTANEPIVFTSTGDPDYGGSTVSRWGCFTISGTGQANFNYVKIRYTGQNPYYHYPSIYNSSGKLSITNSEITNSYGNGINIDNYNAADLTIENNLISNCYIGIEMTRYYGGNFTIQNNMISNSSYHSIYINPNDFRPDSLTGFNSNHFLDDVCFNGGTLQRDLELQGSTYLFTGVFKVPTGVTLTIGPGSLIKSCVTLSYLIKIDINGTLNVNGTSDSPVIFTSMQDTEYGGSTGEYWNGISIESTGSANINYAKIKHAAYGILDCGKLSIMNSTITDISGWGIEVETHFAPTIKYNSFSNCSSALENFMPSYVTVDASYNYWNSEDGPTVPNGPTAGEKISSGVLYIPYYGYNLNAERYFGTENVPSGSYYQQYTDLSMSNSLQTFAIARTYNSLDDRTDTMFGRGWTFNFEGNITEYAMDLVVVRLMNGAACTFRKNDDGSYTAIDSRNTLTKVGGKYVLTTKDQMVYGYDENNRLVSVTDKNGNIITINFDGNGKITSIVDSTGRTYQVAYNGDMVSSITDTGTNRTVSYVYEDNKLTQVIDPEGNSKYYTYDSSGYLNGIYDNDHNLVESVVYNHTSDNNKISNKTDSNGNISTYAYDLTNKIVTITDSNGNQQQQYYDSNLNVIREVDADGEDTIITYASDDKFGEPISVTDRNGNTTAYERDSRGNITKITNPDSSEKIMTYDSKNNLLSSKDEDGKYTFYVYNENGNLIKKAQPLNGIDIYSGTDEGFAVTYYTYYTTAGGAAMNGLLATTTDPEGGVISNTYDSHGNLTSVTDASGKTTSYTYNIDGLLTAEESASGYETTYVYDNNGKQIKKILDEGETYRTVYDGNGRTVKEISPNEYNPSSESGGTYTGDCGTRYTYYASGNIHTKTDAENNTTTYTYDLYGNILTEQLPNGSINRYTYDSLNRVTGKYYKETAESTEYLLESYTYSIESFGITKKSVKTYSDTTNYTIEVYTYDYAAREIEKENADGTTTSTTYNENGTVASTKDAKGNETYFTYDGLNRKIGQWTPFSSGLYSYKGYVYDKAGRALEEISGIDTVAKYEYPTQQITTAYTYNANGTVNSKVDSEGRTTLYYYDAANNVNKTEEYTDSTNKIVTEYVYNHLNKVSSKIQHVRSGDIYTNDYSSNTDVSLITNYSYDDNGNLISMTEPSGVVTTYTYDNLNRKTGTSTPGIDEFGASTTITTSQTYTWDGNIASQTDANGNTKNFVYNGRGKLTKEINTDGGVTLYDYDLENRLIAVVSPNSYDAQKQISEMNRSEYDYDSMGRIITQTQIYYDEDSEEWISYVDKAYKYDANGNVIKELDAEGYDAGTGLTISDKINSGYGTEYTYNYANLLLTELDAVSKDQYLSYSKLYSYDALNRKISETDANGVITKYTYNAHNDVLTEKVQASSSDPEQTVKTYTYDYMGNVLSETDGNGNTITSQYNALGKICGKVYPTDAFIGAKTQYYQYDQIGNLIKTWDSTDAMTEYTYDNQKNKLSETSSKTDETQAITLTYAYDKNGNLRFSTDGKGICTEFTYNVLNKPITKTQNSQTTTNTYDLESNLLSTTDWRGNTYSYEYDQLNRLIEKTDPYEKVIEILTYNNNNLQMSSCDALGHTTHFEYDKNDRLIATIDAENHSTQKSYDHVGNVSTQTDENGNVTHYEYDEFNRLISVINAKNETTSYTYDASGNKLTQTDGKGNVTTYEYNVANLITKIIAAGGRTGTEGNYTYDYSKVESYTYTPSGLMATKTDENNNTTTYTYDIHGQKISEICGSLSVLYTYDNNGNVLTITDGTGTTTRTYDGFNRVISKSVPDIGTSTYVYDITANIPAGCWAETSEDSSENITQKIYDKAGRLLQVIADGKTTQYNYNDNGSVASVLYDNGASEIYTYTDDNQLSSLVNKKADDTVIDSYSYTYDNANNIISKTDSVGTTTYTYDSLNRLLSENTPTKNTSFTYDASGNRLTETEIENNETSITTYTYNSLNRLTNTLTTTNNVTSETVDYVYDNNGNMLTKTVTPYISGIPQTPYIELSNAYDNFNQMITSVTSDGDTINNIYNGEGLRIQKSVNGNATKYVYEYGKIVAEYDGQNNIKAQNIYGLNLLNRIDANESYYYMYNGHADVTALLNAQTDSVDGTYYYDSFGNVLSKTGTIENSILYAGYQYDEETGLYYLNARMYDPVTARFLQEDTYRGDPNDPLSLNQYTYCANNPLKYNDPTGHFFNFITAAIGAGIGAVANIITTAVSDLLDDGQINNGWQCYVGAGVSGAIGGAAAGFTFGGSLIATVAADAAIGAATSAVGNVAEQVITKGSVDLKETAQMALGGAIGGGGGRLLSAGVSKLVNKSVISNVDDVVDDVLSKSKYVSTIESTIPDPESYVDDIVSNVSISNTNALALTDDAAKAVSNVSDDALGLIDDVGKAADEVSAGVNNVTKADFYVTPSGEAIPSTGYRYISENASYLDDLNATKTIPANSNGTYFSFNKYEFASPGKLQVPHDASIRASFDTLQIIDDIRIPNGNYGKANYLEPLTKDFPEFGIGGATQAVTNSQIILNEITNLQK